jgi:hypothetical protein
MSEQDPHGRIEKILDELSATAPPAVVAQVQELLRSVLALHRDGLSRLVEGLDKELLTRLSDDPAVDGLLVLHDLHPLDLPTRAAHVVHRLREEVSGLELELSGVETNGVVHVRLSATGCSVTQLAADVEERLLAALPDAAGVVVDPIPPQAVLQLSPTRRREA